jgi:hypothetical protein
MAALCTDVDAPRNEGHRNLGQAGLVRLSREITNITEDGQVKKKLAIKGNYTRVLHADTDYLRIEILSFP